MTGGRGATVKHQSRVQRCEGPGREGRRGHRARVTSGSLRPLSRFHPNPNQVSSLSQQVTLEEGCIAGGHVPWACTTDGQTNHFAMNPNKRRSNGHLSPSLTTHSQEPTTKASGCTADNLTTLPRRPSTQPAHVCTHVCVWGGGTAWTCWEKGICYIPQSRIWALGSR